VRRRRVLPEWPDGGGFRGVVPPGYLAGEGRPDGGGSRRAGDRGGFRGVVPPGNRVSGYGLPGISGKAMAWPGSMEDAVTGAVAGPKRLPAAPPTEHQEPV
jgi:hypothetical protein